jgi:hypothetical protein
MSKLAKTTFLISAILLILAVTLFGMVAYWVSNQGETLSEQITALASEREQESSFLRLQRTFDSTVEDRQKLQSLYLASESNSIDFLNLIEGIAPEAGVELTTNSLDSKIDDTDNTEWVVVDFVFTGTRTNVQNFIQILENLPYVVRLNRVELNEQSTNVWEAAVNIQAIVLPYDK